VGNGNLVILFKVQPLGELNFTAAIDGRLLLRIEPILQQQVYAEPIAVSATPLGPTATLHQRVAAVQEPFPPFWVQLLQATIGF
jgi:hypothetical protein